MPAPRRLRQTARLVSVPEATTQPAPVSPRYLTVKEAADYLNTSDRFIRRLIADRRIAFHKLGSHVRICVTDLDAFLLAGRVEPITAANFFGGVA